MVRLRLPSTSVKLRRMSSASLVVSFPDAGDAEANVFAASLRDHLRDVIPAEVGFESYPRRTNPHAQDFGASLVLVLGTASATAVAKGIYAWLRGHTGASMEMTTPGGHVIVRNAESRSLEEIAKALANAGPS
jgi:hypothetical protein